MLFIVILFLFPVPLYASSVDQAWAKSLQDKSAQTIEAYLSQAKRIVGQNRRCLLQNSRLSSQTKSQENTSSKKKSLFIFVSFSMPLETLQALADEARSHGGHLVFRGLTDGSFQKTAQKFQLLKRQVLLDPTLFRDHDVKTVPTFLQCQGKICHRLSGNVTLAYALKQFGSYQGESK